MAEAKNDEAPSVKPINPKAIIKKKALELRQDNFILIWVVFAAALVLMTVFFKEYVKQMINISILFMLFWYLEPLLFGATGNTLTAYLSRGQKVPVWKRFPLFVLAVILVYLMYSGMESLLDAAFPQEHVNVVFVVMWIGFLYLMWQYKFSREKEL